MKLELVCDKRNKFGIGRLPLGIADSIAEKSLEGIQITTIPCHFDSVANSPLHSGRCGLEGLGDLRVQYLGDGIGVPYGPPTGVLRTATKPEIIQSSLLLSLLVNAPMLHRACSTIIVNPNIKVKFQTNKHLKKVFSE